MGGELVVRSRIYPLQEHHITIAAVTIITPVHFRYQAIKVQVFALFM